MNVPVYACQVSATSFGVTRTTSPRTLQLQLVAVSTDQLDASSSSAHVIDAIPWTVGFVFTMIIFDSMFGLFFHCGLFPLFVSFHF